MTTSATAAKVSQTRIGEPSTSGQAAASQSLVVAAGVVEGAALDALLGAAQASGLRTLVRHPWRWVGASTAAWAPAMTVIFLGASVPGTGWPTWSVAVLGAVTGLAAGAVFGVISAWFLPSLDGPPARNRVVLRLLRSPAHRALDGSLAGLRVRGAVTGQAFEFPVQYARANDDVVIFPGHPESKRWWRNLSDPSTVDVLLQGMWRPGCGRLLRAGDNGYDTALATYRTRWPRVRIPLGSPLVHVTRQR